MCGNPTSVADMCPWTTPNMRPIRTTTMLSRTTILSRRSWLSVRKPRHPEVWSSRFVGEGYGPSHDTWEPVSSFVPRVNTPFTEYIRKHKTKIHVSDLAALTRAIAARGA